ncbi:hypothetical protein NQ318_003570 [Aromia moschata]|uniref:PX domain-containing protein n=1 Tax=Aromia moschata TaxID=1265417 RepID=A0AAV8YXI5_9CUCU|nr:hypothetical protein NQ318_003570 [Aromia moschata]
MEQKNPKAHLKFAPVDDFKIKLQPPTRVLPSIQQGYNIHINGVFHCTVRYKQLHNLNEQLKKEFGNDSVPPFPPKKLLPLTTSQLEDRRALLEKYIQTVGQDSKLVSSR